MIIQAELHSQEMVLRNLALANLCFKNPLDTVNTQHMQYHKQHQHHYDLLTETSKDPFINLTADQASGKRNTINAHSALEKIYIDKLIHSEDQKKSITNLYQNSASTWDLQYRSNLTNEQAAALAVLQELKLDATSLNALDNQWSVVWNNRERKMRKENVCILYQW